jgi:hypothetical protein
MAVLCRRPPIRDLELSFLYCWSGSGCKRTGSQNGSARYAAVFIGHNVVLQLLLETRAEANA